MIITYYIHVYVDSFDVVDEERAGTKHLIVGLIIVGSGGNATALCISG